MEERILIFQTKNIQRRKRDNPNVMLTREKYNDFIKY